MAIVKRYKGSERRGQCFLCLEERAMALVVEDDRNGTMTYLCPLCGGHNGRDRIERNEDVYGRYHGDYGPVRITHEEEP